MEKIYFSQGGQRGAVEIYPPSPMPRSETEHTPYGCYYLIIFYFPTVGNMLFKLNFSHKGQDMP